MELMPNQGGCWFCHKEEQEEDLLFDFEFDTFVHKSCIQRSLNNDNNNMEAIIMSYLLEERK